MKRIYESFNQLEFDQKGQINHQWRWSLVVNNGLIVGNYTKMLNHQQPLKRGFSKGVPSLDLNRRWNMMSIHELIRMSVRLNMVNSLKFTQCELSCRRIFKTIHITPWFEPCRFICIYIVWLTKSPSEVRDKWLLRCNRLDSIVAPVRK